MVFAASCTPAGGAAAPTRIVTTNLCADQLVLLLAPPGHVVSVSNLAADPAYSNIAPAAAGIPVNYGRAEEIVRYNPDLVVSGSHREHATNVLLRSLRFDVFALRAPESLAETWAAILELATVLGQRQRGERLVEDIQGRLARVGLGTSRERLGAVIVRPNGHTAGTHTIVTEVLSAAGLHNLATELGVARYGYLSLEGLSYAPPRVLILDDYGQQKSSLAQRLLLHPALRGIGPRTLTVSMATRLWLCAGPWLAEAAEQLATATSGLRP